MTNQSNENRNAAFLESLYEEKLRHKDHRHTFVVQKLLFIIGLFGLGVLDIKGGGDNILFNNGFLLYLVPFVALAYDLYIHAEDFKVKRIGFFVRTREKQTVGGIEIDWEKWVSSHREGLAEQASKALTWIASLTAFLLILLLDATHPFGEMKSTGFFILDLIRDFFCYNFFILWSLFTFYFIKRAGALSGESNEILRYALRVLSPLTLNVAEEKITADKKGKLSPELEEEFKNQLLRIPIWVEITKSGKEEWAVFEKRRRFIVFFVKHKKQLYTIKKEEGKLIIQQLY